MHQTVTVKASSTNTTFNGTGRIVGVTTLKIVVDLGEVPNTSYVAVDTNSCYVFVGGAGWDKPETSTSTSIALRPPLLDGSTTGVMQPCSFAVDDSYGIYAKVRAYESLTAVIAGTGPFPTLSQAAMDSYTTPKPNSTTVESPWIIVADSQMMYLFTTVNATDKAYCLTMFGYPRSRMASDPLGCIMHANTTSNNSWSYTALSALNTTGASTYIARSHTGLVSSQVANLYGLAMCNCGDGAETFPSVIDNALNVSPIYLVQSGGGMRAVMKGLLQPLQNKPFAGTVGFYDGLADYPGQIVMAVPVASYHGNATAPTGEVHVVVSGSW